MNRQFKRGILVLGGVVGLAWLGWAWTRVNVIDEDACPDRLDLGTVYAGSTVEFSARFLASARKHPLDRIFEQLVSHLPREWQSAVSKWHPNQFRHPTPPLDLTQLKPQIRTPGYAHVQDIKPRQQKEWYENRPFEVVQFSLDTSSPGEFTDQVKLTLGKRRSFLPLHVRILPSPKTGSRLLITSTPYLSDSTQKGSDFAAVTKVLSETPLIADYRLIVPQDLAPYRTILLADDTLARMSPGEATCVSAFAARGGRLILACNAFFHGTVGSANDVLADAGLEVIDKDWGGAVTVTDIPPDALTQGVGRLQFQRPSLVMASKDSNARMLAPSPDGKGGFIAASKLASGGEVIVLSQSLWWAWVNATNSDNPRLLANLLEGAK